MQVFFDNNWSYHIIAYQMKIIIHHKYKRIFQLQLYNAPYFRDKSTIININVDKDNGHKVHVF